MTNSVDPDETALYIVDPDETALYTVCNSTSNVLSGSSAGGVDLNKLWDKYGKELMVLQYLE